MATQFSGPENIQKINTFSPNLKLSGSSAPQPEGKMSAPLKRNATFRLGHPFGSEKIKASIERFLISLGYQTPKVTFRRSASNKYVTDQQNYILDLHLNEILDPKTLSYGLLQIVGVVEVGLFIDMASKIIIGNDDGSCKVI